jgi:hypothetical protein
MKSLSSKAKVKIQKSKRSKKSKESKESNLVIPIPFQREREQVICGHISIPWNPNIYLLRIEGKAANIFLLKDQNSAGSLSPFL